MRAATAVDCSPVRDDRPTTPFGQHRSRGAELGEPAHIRAGAWRRRQMSTFCLKSPGGCIVWLWALLSPPAAWAAESDLAWLLAEPDRIVLLRHAVAPGTGDPAHFRLGDCATQRNLSSAGRSQAARIGARLRAAGLVKVPVYSSQWCRSLETARVLDVGPVTELPALNSFFGAREREGEYVEAMRAWIATADLSRPVVLVTHQVNITALTGVVPASGEMLIIGRKADGLEVLARLRASD
jgi:phosphohistidine phosphatase SixA